MLARLDLQPHALGLQAVLTFDAGPALGLGQPQLLLARPVLLLLDSALRPVGLFPAKALGLLHGATFGRLASLSLGLGFRHAVVVLLADAVILHPTKFFEGEENRFSSRGCWAIEHCLHAGGP